MSLSLCFLFTILPSASKNPARNDKNGSISRSFIILLFLFISKRNLKLLLTYAQNLNPLLLSLETITPSQHLN